MDRTLESQAEHGLDNPGDEGSLARGPTDNAGEASGDKGSLRNSQILIFPLSGSLDGEVVINAQSCDRRVMGDNT